MLSRIYPRKCWKYINILKYLPFYLWDSLPALPFIFAQTPTTLMILQKSIPDKSVLGSLQSFSFRERVQFRPPFFFRYLGRKRPSRSPSQWWITAAIVSTSSYTAVRASRLGGPAFQQLSDDLMRPSVDISTAMMSSSGQWSIVKHPSHTHRETVGTSFSSSSSLFSFSQQISRSASTQES